MPAPIALLAATVLLAHSLPTPDAMLTPDTALRGSARSMVSRAESRQARCPGEQGAVTVRAVGREVEGLAFSTRRTALGARLCGFAAGGYPASLGRSIAGTTLEPGPVRFWKSVVEDLTDAPKRRHEGIRLQDLAVEGEACPGRRRDS